MTNASSMNRLIEAIAKHFPSNKELKVKLCKPLNIPSRKIEGRNATERAYALVNYCQQYELLPKLVAQCAQTKPQENWQELLYSAPTKNVKSTSKDIKWTLDQKLVVIFGIIGTIGVLAAILALPPISNSLFSPPMPATLTFIPQPSATPLPFGTLPSGKSRIVVAMFDGDDNDVAGTIIYDDLRDRAPSNVQVVRYKNVLDDQTARPFGAIVSATLVIWGRYNNVYVQPYVERIWTDRIGYQPEGTKLSLAVPQTATFEILTEQLVSQTAVLSYFGLGLNSYETKIYTESIDYLNKAIDFGLQANHSDLWNIYFFRGDVYYDMRNYPLAIADYNQTIKLKANSASVFNNLGNAYLNKGDLDEAIESYSQAIKFQPNYVLALNNRGSAYSAKGDNDHAIEDQSQAIKFGPNFPVAFLNRSSSYFAKGEYDLAIADCTQAVRLEPDFAEAFYNCGNAYFAKGDNDHAITDYTQAIKLKPDFAEAFNNRGDAYRAIGDTDRAIQDFDHAIKLKPDFAEAFFQRGNTYLAKGDADRAIQDFDHTIKLKPDFAEAFLQRGNAYSVKGDNDRAIQDFDQTIKLKPDTVYAFFNRGNSYSAKGDYDQAIQDYNQAIQLNPQLAEVFNNRGLSYGAKGDYDRAIQDFNQAIQAQPDLAAAFNNRGTAYLRKGNRAAARADYIHCIELGKGTSAQDICQQSLEKLGMP